MDIHTKTKAFQIREATQQDIDAWKAWALAEDCTNSELLARVLAWHRDGRLDLPAQTGFANNLDAERALLLAQTLHHLRELPPRGAAGAIRAWCYREARRLRLGQTPPLLDSPE